MFIAIWAGAALVMAGILTGYLIQITFLKKPVQQNSIKTFIDIIYGC